MSDFRQFRKFEKGEFIVVGCDTSMGAGDYCVAQFLSKTKLDVPMVFRSKNQATDMTNRLLPVLEKIFAETGIRPTIAYERNNGGAFEMDRLVELNRLYKFEVFKMPSYGRDGAVEAHRYGWDTNSATRPKMLQDLKQAIDKQLIKIYDKPTINEMFSFIMVQTTSIWKAQAERHAHDDSVMSLAIAWQLYQMCNMPMDMTDLPMSPLC